MRLRDIFLRSTWWLGNKGELIYPGPSVERVLNLSVEELYRTQPYLQTVVTFVARNIAQLGLHTYERRSDTDRARVHDSPVAQLLAEPNPGLTTYELIYRLVADLKLYDVAVWNVTVSATSRSGWEIWPIPPSWVVQTGGGSAWYPDWIDVAKPGKPRPVRIKAEDLVLFHGYDPANLVQGSSPVETLKGILAEQIHANHYRQQVWQRGGRMGEVITRPAEARWSDAARERFARDWAAKWSGNDGPKAGGTPILEDGMTLNKVRFSAREEEWVDVAKLSLATVAGAYHVNPTMVGLLDNANYSNVREFRRMLYGDTLGPDLRMIAGRLNTFLLPKIGAPANQYVEFNIEEKMRGSFEEQAAVISASVGRPWMTADEARGRFNMPALGGDADQLVVPLNVLIGGQASPRDSAPEPGEASGAPRSKAAPGEIATVRATDGHRAKAEQILQAFFRRQRSVVLSRLGAKADGDWWDGARWDRELADDLFALSVTVATELGRAEAEALGFDPEDYDADRTLAFLKAAAEKRARWINAATRAQVEAVLDADDGSPGDVFDTAESTRAVAAGAALMAAVGAFAVTESAKQLAPDVATKTWRVTSSNPRSAHARMDGETVAIRDRFSNGADWPGDPILGADGVAGCQCSVDIDLP